MDFNFDDQTEIDEEEVHSEPEFTEQQMHSRLEASKKKQQLLGSGKSASREGKDGEEKEEVVKDEDTAEDGFVNVKAEDGDGKEDLKQEATTLPKNPNNARSREFPWMPHEVTNKGHPKTLNYYQAPKTPLAMPDWYTVVPSARQWETRRNNGCEDPVGTTSKPKHATIKIAAQLAKSIAEFDGDRKKGWTPATELKSLHPELFTNNNTLWGESPLHDLYNPTHPDRNLFMRENPLPWIWYRNLCSSGKGCNIGAMENLSILLAENNKFNHTAYMNLRDDCAAAHGKGKSTLKKRKSTGTKAGNQKNNTKKPKGDQKVTSQEGESEMQPDEESSQDTSDVESRLNYLQEDVVRTENRLNHVAAQNRELRERLDRLESLYLGAEDTFRPREDVLATSQQEYTTQEQRNSGFDEPSFDFGYPGSLFGPRSQPYTPTPGSNTMTATAAAYASMGRNVPPLARSRVSNPDPFRLHYNSPLRPPSGYAREQLRSILSSPVANPGTTQDQELRSEVPPTQDSNTGVVTETFPTQLDLPEENHDAVPNAAEGSDVATVNQLQGSRVVDKDMAVQDEAPKEVSVASSSQDQIPEAANENVASQGDPVQSSEIATSAQETLMSELTTDTSPLAAQDQVSEDPENVTPVRETFMPGGWGAWD